MGHDYDEALCDRNANQKRNLGTEEEAFRNGPQALFVFPKRCCAAVSAFTDISHFARLL